MLRVILIDDEALARQGLRRLLRAHPDVEVIAEAKNVDLALEALKETSPDALFLDIRMPKANGFDLLKRLPDCPPVVFVTAYSEYAVQAYEVQAVDYLLKPVRPARLAQALSRLGEAAGKGKSPETPYGLSDRICLRTPERTLVAPLGDVILLQADKDFTRVTVAGAAPILICQSLGVYERNLPSPPFLRIDRSIMLNTARIQSVEVSPTRGAHVSLEGWPAAVPIGKAALRRLKRAFPQSLSGI